MPTIDPSLRISSVTLDVADLSRSVDFYERVLGLALIERDEHRAALGPDPDSPSLVLGEIASPSPLPPGATGLYHVAWLHPTRAALAESVRRIAAGGWRLEGAADHGVSEALYLSDPDGLGIEIYADRPRELWDRPADGRGVKMTTLALDLDDLLAQAQNEPDAGDRARHRRRARAHEGHRRSPRRRLLSRRARPGGAGPAALRRVPRRRRLPPPRRPELVAKPRRRTRARQLAGPAEGRARAQRPGRPGRARADARRCRLCRRGRATVTGRARGTRPRRPGCSRSRIAQAREILG